MRKVCLHSAEPFRKEESSMGLRSADVQKLDAFLHKLRADVYPEHPSDLHSGITEQMWQVCLNECQLQPGASVLDIGCGQGVALRHFRAAGK